MYPLGTPNCWPVLDLAGNVWEWCLSPREKPRSSGSLPDVSRVLRGGPWGSGPRYCRAAYRDGLPPDYRFLLIGFRVCRGAPIEPPGAAPLDTGLSKC